MKCEICGRETPKENSEKHHLTPKGGRETIKVCSDCGDQLHNMFTNNELKKDLNTLDKIKKHDKMQPYLKFIKKRKKFGLCQRKKK